MVHWAGRKLILKAGSIGCQNRISLWRTLTRHLAICIYESTSRETVSSGDRFLKAGHMNTFVSSYVNINWWILICIHYRSKVWTYGSNIFLWAKTVWQQSRSKVESLVKFFKTVSIVFWKTNLDISKVFTIDANRRIVENVLIFFLVMKIDRKAAVTCG